jgi:hypothetical protein
MKSNKGTWFMKSGKAISKEETVKCAVFMLVAIILLLTTIKSIISGYGNVSAGEPQANITSDNTSLPVSGVSAALTNCNSSDIVIAYKVSDESPYNGEFTVDMDILNREDISETQMNKIIDHFTEYEDNKDSIFKNKGRMFCEISNTYRLDPIFILMLSANTYGWTYTKNDVDLRDDFTDVNEQFEYDINHLAAFAYETYYVQRNCHTLKDMATLDDYKYAVNENWANAIAEAMDEAYTFL